MSNPKQTTTEHKQYNVKTPEYDGYDQVTLNFESVGSQRRKKVLESGEIHSTNFKIENGVIVSGWRLTRRGIETVAAGLFPPGSITFTDIQTIAANKILGRITAGTGVIEQLSAAQVKTLLAIVAADIPDFNEAAEDAVGNVLADSSTIDFTYNDGGDSITAVLISQFRRKSLFDHFADVGNIGTGEDDLYSDTIAAAQLANNGEKLEAEYGGIFVSSATATREIKIYFGGTLIFDTGALTLSLSSVWTAYVTIIRVSASVVRCMVSFTTEGAALAAYTSYTEVAGLTLANTQVLKITSEAAGVGAATNDIVAKMAVVEWKAAA